MIVFHEVVYEDLTNFSPFYTACSPERGSFPLDHDGMAGPRISSIATVHFWVTAGANVSIGECKHVMIQYLSCIKKVKGLNDEACRSLAKNYLACRMDR
jgi:cytochrome c oxidase assembly protein subunit 19